MKLESLKVSKEKLIYILICSFALIASFTTLLDFFYLRTLSKILQALTIILCFPLVLSSSFKSNDSHRNDIAKLSLFILIYITLLLIKDLFNHDVPIDLIVRNYLQIFFIYFWIFLMFKIPPEILEKITLFVTKIFVYGLFFSCIEFITPSSLKEFLIKAIYGVIPESYLSRDISFFPMRLGSFYIEPLLFSYTIIYLICNNANTKKKTVLYFFIAVVAQTKTSIIGGIAILLGKKNKYLSIIGLGILFILVVLICVNFDGYFFYYTFDGTIYKSIANHIAGLVFGLDAAFDNLFGNGLGKSGFYVASFMSNNPSLGNIYNITSLENGDESSIGVIAYQLGGIFIMLHVILFLYLFFYHIKNKQFNISTFILIILGFQAFSESALTLLIIFSQAVLLAKKTPIKIFNHENSNN